MRKMRKMEEMEKVKKVKKALVLLFFTLFMLNVFANTALSQINSILTNRLNAETVEKRGEIKENDKAKEAQEFRRQVELEAINNPDINNVNKINKIKTIKKILGPDYEFIFFYRSNCPYCRKFDPILKQYSIDTTIPVRAFTLDGISLPSFPNSITVNPAIVHEYFGSSAEDRTIAVPTLFIMNIANLHVYPVSRGALSYTDLVMRMNELIPKILFTERQKELK